MRLLVLLATTLVSHVVATVPAYGQCGGIGYTGDTACAVLTTCTKFSDYYSQCVPSNAGSTPTATSATSTTTCASIFARTTGPPIKAITPGTAVTGLYVNADSANNRRAVLSTHLKAGPDLFRDGTLYQLNYKDVYTSCLSKDYFDVHETGYESVSYKPIYWDWDTPTTYYWANVVPIQTLSTSPYGVASSFLACQEAGQWVVYLQTGTDVPAGETCVVTELQPIN